MTPAINILKKIDVILKYINMNMIQITQILEMKL